jgi:hypothetical protein
MPKRPVVHALRLAMSRGKKRTRQNTTICHETVGREFTLLIASQTGTYISTYILSQYDQGANSAYLGGTPAPEAAAGRGNTVARRR